MEEIRYTDLLALIEQDGFQAVRTSTSRGGQLNGPCPWCGGDDRFRVQPHRGPYGWYACSQCDRKGNAVVYLVEKRGFSKYAALMAVGWKPKEGSEPRFITPPSALDERPPWDEPPERWQNAASTFYRACQQTLWSDAGRAALDYLRGRGLSDSTITYARLGYHAHEEYGPAHMWGRSKPVKLWQGITIPWFSQSTLWRVTVRDERVSAGAGRYKQLAGGSNGLYLADSLALGRTRVLVTEGEFDALSVAQVYGRKVATVATGTTQGGHTPRWIGLLARVPCVWLAFDADESGDAAALWWQERLPDAQRLRPWWSDASQMLQDGVDLAAWIEHGGAPSSQPVTTLPAQVAPAPQPIPRALAPVPARDFPFPHARIYVRTLCGTVGYLSRNDHPGCRSVQGLLDKLGTETSTSGPLEHLTWEQARAWWLAQTEGEPQRPAPVRAAIPETRPPEQIPTLIASAPFSPAQPTVPVTQAGTFLAVVAELTEQYRQSPGRVALDLETTGLSPRQHKVISLALGVPGQVTILDLRPYDQLPEEEQRRWREAICQLLRMPGVTWVGQNLTFDWQFLAAHFGAHLDTVYDTMLAEQVLHGMKQSRGRVGFSLRDLAERYGLSVSKEERNWFVDLDQRPAEWAAPFPEEQVRYMVQDIEVPSRIAQRQQPLLEQHQLQAIADLENQCVPALASIALHGVLVDQEHWRQALRLKEARKGDLEKELTATLGEAISAARAQMQAEEKRLMHLYTSDPQARRAHTWEAFRAQGLHAWAQSHPGAEKLPAPGQFINLGSGDQVKAALAQLGIHVTSTKEEALEGDASNPLIATLLAWRKLNHFCDAFGENLLALVEDDGRMHAHFAQVGAVSGRIICSKPNLQQIPRKREQGSEEEDIRRCFIAPPGSVLLTSDLSNIELRILAEVSRDETMLRLFAEQRDLHAETAKLMFRLPPETNTEQHLYQGVVVRDIAKQINYGLAYGMSASGLACRVNVSVEEARKLMDTYTRTYPGATRWLRQTAQRIQRQGYVASLAGRKRFFSLAEASQSEQRSIERMARNHPIQGTNADILKRAMTLLYSRLPVGVHIVLAVHDELVLECPEPLAEEATHILKRALVDACRADLKLVHIPEPKVLRERYWKKG